jgi:hypothetical protein
MHGQRSPRTLLRLLDWFQGGNWSLNGNVKVIIVLNFKAILFIVYSRAPYG